MLVARSLDSSSPITKSIEMSIQGLLGNSRAYISLYYT
jgi:hypothetical protein